MFSFRTSPIGEQLDKALLDGRVACFCTQNCWDTLSGRYLYDIFKDRGNLVKVLLPREAEITPQTNHIDFNSSDIEGIDAVVVEIQDVGSRYFNYTRDVCRLISCRARMEEGPAIYVVDHINPAGRIVEGTMPSVDADLWTPKVAHRHGLTLGELCYLYSVEIGAKFPLHVISAEVSEVGKDILPWTIAPASDIPGMFTALMYSGGGLWNSTSVTPGIGTTRPYELIGAPYICNADIPPCPQGVLMRPCSFTPAAGIYAGTKCFGYQIILLPGAEYHSLLHTIELMHWFSQRYSLFEISSQLLAKISDPVIAEYLHDGITFDIVREHVKSEEQKWIRKAKRFLLYDDAPCRIK